MRRETTKTFEATIRRHGVLAANRNPFEQVKGGEKISLTAFQAELLEHQAPIRICSAPTGAGKTFAFEWAPALGLNILFIVPTRRLAQNLEANVRATMLQDFDFSEEEVARRLAVWTSDRALAKEAAGMTRQKIRQERVAQLRGQNFESKGTFIIATPESVALLLLKPPVATHGQPVVSIADILGRDHIVFDEFHTIEEQGFGLAAAVCKITSGIANAGEFGVRPKITFLSATPVSIEKTLKDFDIPETEFVHLEEKVFDWGVGEEPVGARIVHGDVSVSMYHHETIAEACRAEEEMIRAVVARGQSIICVFDSLARVKATRAEISEIFKGFGVPVERIMTINSIDDWHHNRQDEHGVWGRDVDPSTASVILATSSVEMGVTFDAPLMIMEPGFSEASFIQRVGRVARRDVSGRVVVVRGQNVNLINNLLRGQTELVEAGKDGNLVSVEQFTRWALHARLEAFAGDDILPGRVTFSTLASKASWCAALFWVALERVRWIYKGERDTLLAFRPNKARTLGWWIRQIEKSDSYEARAWVRQFVEQAKDLRAIEARVRVAFQGNEDHIPISMAGRYPDIANATVCEDAKGPYLALQRPLTSILCKGDTKFFEARMTPFPLFVDAQTGPLRARDAVSEWVEKTKAYAPALGYGTDEGSLVDLATRLVRTTSLLPSIDKLDEEGMGEGSGVV